MESDSWFSNSNRAESVIYGARSTTTCTASVIRINGLPGGNDRDGKHVMRVFGRHFNHPFSRVCEKVHRRDVSERLLNMLVKSVAIALT